MIKASKMEYYNEIIRRYTESDKYEKGTILDEYCKVSGYNRKYAIQKLSRKLLLKLIAICKIGIPKKYCSKAIETYIMSVWKTTNLICSKRLKVPLLDQKRGLSTTKPGSIIREMIPNEFSPQQAAGYLL